MTKPGESYTAKTRAWLENRFHVESGEYYRAHEPIYGINRHAEHTEPDHIWRVAKTVQIMRVLAGIDFRTMLDIGAAEGYTSDLARRLFGVEVTVSDVSLEAMLRARDFFGLPGVSLNASNLPFKDDAFDVVLCAECIEHLEHPYELILEMARVARKCVVISTYEGQACYAASRLALLKLPVDEPHGHRSSWCPRDFTMMLGPSVIASSQNEKRPWTMSEPFTLMKSVAVPPPPMHLGEGIIVHRFFDESARRPAPMIEDDRLLREILDAHVDLRPASATPDDTPPPPSLVAALRCPTCRKDGLAVAGRDVACASCGARYGVRGGVPDLYVEAAADLEALAELPKLGPVPTARQRVRWARKRARQFDRAPRVTSLWMKRRIVRLIRFVEFLDAQPGLRAKAAFLAGKVLRRWGA